MVKVDQWNLASPRAKNRNCVFRLNWKSRTKRADILSFISQKIFTLQYLHPDHEFPAYINRCLPPLDPIKTHVSIPIVGIINQSQENLVSTVSSDGEFLDNQSRQNTLASATRSISQSAISSGFWFKSADHIRLLLLLPPYFLKVKSRRLLLLLPPLLSIEIEWGRKIDERRWGGGDRREPVRRDIFNLHPEV